MRKCHWYFIFLSLDCSLSLSSVGKLSVQIPERAKEYRKKKCTLFTKQENVAVRIPVIFPQEYDIHVMKYLSSASVNLSHFPTDLRNEITSLKHKIYTLRLVSVSILEAKYRNFLK